MCDSMGKAGDIMLTSQVQRDKMAGLHLQEVLRVVEFMEWKSRKVDARG